MKKTVKKPVKKATKKVDKPLTTEEVCFLVRHELLHLQVSEVEPLKKRIAELEGRLSFEPRMFVVAKEPETFKDCVNICKTSHRVGYDGVETYRTSASQQLMLGMGVPSEKRAKQLAAIAKMMTVADALNPSGVTPTLRDPDLKSPELWDSVNTPVRFDVRHIEKLFSILGEDTIKTAFGL